MDIGGSLAEQWLDKGSCLLFIVLHARNRTVMVGSLPNVNIAWLIYSIEEYWVLNLYLLIPYLDSILTSLPFPWTLLLFTVSRWIWNILLHYKKEITSSVGGRLEDGIGGFDGFHLLDRNGSESKRGEAELCKLDVVLLCYPLSLLSWLRWIQSFGLGAN